MYLQGGLWFSLSPQLCAFFQNLPSQTHQPLTWVLYIFTILTLTPKKKKKASRKLPLVSVCSHHLEGDTAILKRSSQGCTAGELDLGPELSEAQAQVEVAKEMRGQTAFSTSLQSPLVRSQPPFPSWAASHPTKLLPPHPRQSPMALDSEVRSSQAFNSDASGAGLVFSRPLQLPLSSVRPWVAQVFPSSPTQNL